MKHFFITLPVLATAFMAGGCVDAIKGDFSRQRGNIAYMQNLDYAAAVPLYQEAIASNDSEANYRMGMMILEGATGGSQQQAIGYITEAAENGHVNAQSFLGRAALHGSYGVRKDSGKALHYLEQAAAKNDEMALYSLALAYAGAFNVPKDPARAVACYRRLGELGWNVPPALKDESTFSKKTKKIRTGRPGVFTTKLTQEYLNKLGYKAGSPNGVLSKTTQSAIRRFQRDIGRSETGKPSMALLRDLHKAMVERFF